MPIKRRPPADNVRTVQSHGGNLRGVTVNKTGRSVQFEYFREMKLILLLDRDTTVRDFCSQPETFEYYDRNGKLHHYTPDFRVWRTDGRVELHQVIRKAESNTLYAVDRKRAMDAICSERGWTYHVHIEDELLTETELANLQALAFYEAGVYANPQVEAAARERLANGVRMPLVTLSSSIADQLGIDELEATAALCHMLWHSALDVDLRTRLIFRHARPVPQITVGLAATAGANTSAVA